ncbi:MMS19 nucleotide excision repair protein-like protein isoform X2 [Iris pallida]|uniref:MMS19 nucleotide excision repair protein n=1 Tax=Iris pallida TaxID=29817 RepID=A0AAX6G7R1_IRIPA|nr:MMS19 nucleotide excision repair protein-like protein isoform X2 [Iris pallida]
MVVNTDVKALAESYLINVQVRSLAVHDRKLCFEVLLCLMDAYPDTVMTLGDDFIYGICDAIEEETDPRCLMLTFCLVETLMRTFQDPSCSVASFAGDIFDILGRYFPIYFTHPRSDDFEVKRDDLSRALMNAYCSSPLFEPFVIPLLLDKLSSSVPLAKLDSLKYLTNCIIQYGAGKMVKHAKAIWVALKDVIFNFSTKGNVSSMISESTGDMVSQEGQIVKEALICLQTMISQLNFPGGDSFINLILDDHDISTNFESLSSGRSYSETSIENLHRLSALGAILSIASKVSTDCCSRVFQKLFPRLMNLLGVPISSSSNACFMEKKMSNDLNFGALYLCTELLASCQELTTTVQDLSQRVEDSWWSLLNNSSGPLTYILKSSLVNLGSFGGTVREHASYAVKGLQVLATFPGDCSPISDAIYEDILAVLVSIITGNHDDTFLWNLSLKSLAQIGLYIEKVHDSKKGSSYKKIVVETIVSLLSLDDSTISLAQKLEALSEIGVTGPEYMSMVIDGIEEAIISNFSKACVDGNLRSAEILVPLLECYSNRVLPWCHKSGRIEQVAMQFAVNIWNLMETSGAFGICLERKGLLDSSMMAMKCAVAHCTEGQGHIVQKAYNIVLSTISSPLESLFYPSSKLDGLQFIPDASGLSCIDTKMPVTRPLSQVLGASFSCKDEWLVSLFASVVTALRPLTPLPDVHTLIKLFVANLLRGHIPAAQALASIINKWPADGKIEVPSTCKLDEVIGLILESIYAVLFSSPLKQCNFEKDLSCICPSSLQMHAIDGLAWVGKGLLLRGHERLKEIAMVLMKCILPSQNNVVTSEHPNESGNSQDRHLPAAKSAANAFHILMSDSEVCLTKKFHSKIRPLYKQRFFSSMLPVLLSSITNCNSPNTRYVLYRAFGHVISGTPLAAVVADSKKVLLPLLDGLSVLSSDLLNKEMTYSLLLVLSGILMDENGKETVMENVHIIISHLIRLISYPHSMLVRETAIQCLVAMSALPHSKIYPMRPQVLRALSNSLDDRKRAVRQEAVRCRQAWASIASRSLHF